MENSTVTVRHCLGSIAYRRLHGVQFQQAAVTAGADVVTAAVEVGGAATSHGCHLKYIDTVSGHRPHAELRCSLAVLDTSHCVIIHGTGWVPLHFGPK